MNIPYIEELDADGDVYLSSIERYRAHMRHSANQAHQMADEAAVTETSAASAYRRYAQNCEHEAGLR